MFYLLLNSHKNTQTTESIHFTLLLPTLTLTSWTLTALRLNPVRHPMLYGQAVGWTVGRSVARSNSYLYVSLLHRSCSISKHLYMCNLETTLRHNSQPARPPDRTPYKRTPFTLRATLSPHRSVHFTVRQLNPFHLNRSACLLPVLPCFILSTVLPHSVAQQLVAATRRWPLAKHFVSISL